MLANALFTISVTICKIIMYELPNVPYSIDSFTLTMKVKDADVLIENWQKHYFITLYMYAQIGASMSITLFLVTFHDGYTYGLGKNGRTNTIRHRTTPEQ